MRKFIIYILIIAIGSFGVYFGLAYKDTIKEHIFSGRKKTEPKKSDKKDEKETIPSKDGFISEAIKLQTLAENTGGNETCKCYNVKDLDRNTSLEGSILVYTIDDLFVSSMWLSNGYYILNGYENAASGNLEDSSEKASIYCGEADSSTRSSLCATNY